jgi:hypothetical protein
MSTSDLERPIWPSPTKWLITEDSGSRIQSAVGGFNDHWGQECVPMAGILNDFMPEYGYAFE